MTQVYCLECIPNYFDWIGEREGVGRLAVLYLGLEEIDSVTVSPIANIQQSERENKTTTAVWAK